MLTRDQVVEAIVNYGQPGGRGRVEALRRANIDGLRSMLTSSQRALLESVATAPVSAPAAGYAHPAREARVHRMPSPRGTASQPEPLTPAQVAFLNRLPAEPDKVPYAAAVEVFRLLAGNVAPQDAPLVQSIADPLLSWHDRNAANAQLAAAQTKPPPIPSTALGALADAIASENGDLRPNEALGRASDVIAELSSRRLGEHEGRVAAARQRIAQLDAADVQRVAVTR